MYGRPFEWMAKGIDYFPGNARSTHQVTPLDTTCIRTPLNRNCGKLASGIGLHYHIYIYTPLPRLTALGRQVRDLEPST